MRFLTVEPGVRRVLVLQVILAALLVSLVVLVSAVLSGPVAIKTLGLARAKSAAFGALLGILGTVITARSVLKSSRAAQQSPDLGPYLGMLPLYFGLLFKLLLVAGGVFAGLAYFELGPFYIVLGYIIMQAGYLGVAGGRHKPGE